MLLHQTLGSFPRCQASVRTWLPSTAPRAYQLVSISCLAVSYCPLILNDFSFYSTDHCGAVMIFRAAVGLHLIRSQGCLHCLQQGRCLCLPVSQPAMHTRHTDVTKDPKLSALWTLAVMPPQQASHMLKHTQKTYCVQGAML